MKKVHLALAVLALSIAFAGSCKPDPAAHAADAKEKQDEAIQTLDQSFEKLKSDHAEVVDFRLLKDGLPDKMLGMDRIDHSGQKAGIAEMQFSMAEATYADGDKKVAVKIIDTGGLGALLSSMAVWSQIEVDKEDQDGYERTTMIGSKKAIEKYNRTHKEGEISMIMADRFIVDVGASNISEDELRQVISQIRIKI